jgi:hypothetical protein
MTKNEAVAKIEGAGAKVLAARMSNGLPKVTISWTDYLKVRNTPEVVSGQIELALRS